MQNKESKREALHFASTADKWRHNRALHGPDAGAERINLFLTECVSFLVNQPVRSYLYSTESQQNHLKALNK